MSDELDLSMLVAARLDAAAIPDMLSGSMAMNVDVEGHAIRVVSPEDLVLSKLAWAKPSHSEMQLRDVRNLIGCVPDLDWQHLDRWARELDVADLLAEVRP